MPAACAGSRCDVWSGARRTQALTIRGVVATSVMLAVLSASSGLRADDAVPRDFRLTAEYYPALPHLGVDISGLPPGNRWTLTVTADGKALQETQRSPRESPKGITRRSVRLTRRDLARLVTAVRPSTLNFVAPDDAVEVSHASALVLRHSLVGPY